MSQIQYGYVKELQLGFDEAVSRVTEALKQEGFGILAEIDVAKTLQDKLGVGFRRYKILGACNPSYAHQALQNEEQVGLLLPCNVVVQEAPEGEAVSVSVIDPKALFRLIDNPGVEPLAAEVDAALKRALENV